MSNLIDFLRGREHEIILDESEVLDTLRVINTHQRWSINQKLAVGDCEWDFDATKWYIYFSATNWQWKLIINDLSEKGYTLEIRDNTERVYLIRKSES